MGVKQLHVKFSICTSAGVDISQAGEGFINLVSGSGGSTSLIQLSSDPALFSRRVSAADLPYLGYNYIKPDNNNAPAGHLPSQFFPACIPINVASSLWTSSNYMKLTFDNGYSIRYNTPLASSGGSTFFYNENGVEIFNINKMLLRVQASASDDRQNLYIIAPTAIDSDGTIPDTASFNVYSYIANWGGASNPYGQIEGISSSYNAPLRTFFNAISAYVEDTDPYADGGYSGGGGGDGSFDLHNDSIDFPSLPTLSAVDTGLVSIYTPSLSQLKALATFLWNANPTDVDWWKKLVANPLDLILGLSIVPVQVPQGAAQTIKVGLVDTGVSVTKAASQFVTVDCGSVTIQKNCGGSALDYSPFTKFSLYLPFIGTRTISCDDIMGRTVHVKYNVDLLSGGCTAMVKITGGPEDNELNAILYQYSGACAISIPLTGETFTNMITSTIQLAASIGATVATGGAASGVTAASAANSLMSMKPIIERAGGVSGAAGQLGIMQPYLIAEVPRQSVPENCNQFTGYPSNMKAKIGDLAGYTEVDIVYLKGIEATQAELDELESVLKGGFII